MSLQHAYQFARFGGASAAAAGNQRDGQRELIVPNAQRNDRLIPIGSIARRRRKERLKAAAGDKVRARQKAQRYTPQLFDIYERDKGKSVRNFRDVALACKCA